MVYPIQNRGEMEVWINTATGDRWFKALDVRGREVGRTVGGGRTFTITTFERQLNQEAAASPELDLFRNGTFVLRKPGEATVAEEVRSPNSLTNAEVDDKVQEIMFGDLGPAEVLSEIDSPVTLQRILEGLVIEDAATDKIGYVKGRLAELIPPVPMRQVIDPVFTAPDPDPSFDIATDTTAEE